MLQKPDFLILATFLWVVLSAPDTIAQEQEKSLLEESRALAQRFAMQLQTELKAALSDGGPIHAIAVCRDEAPKIASALSRQSGAKVGRTSLRPRNAINAPESWQSKVLNQYFQPTVQITDARIEYFSASSGDLRYMQAIRTGGLCLTCHGQMPEGDLTRALDVDYPYDQARGYEIGSLRGAFSIIWPNAGRYVEGVEEAR